MKTGTLAGILNRTATCLPIALIFGVCWLFSFSLYSQNTHPNSIFQVNERTLGNNVSVNINLPVLSHEGQILSGHSVTSNPLKGTLNTTVGNSYIYTPNYFQVGNDSFDWQALDTSTGITATYRCIIQINSLNSPPTDLNSTSPLTIAENQPIGTILGEFNATDPDLNKRFTQGLGTKIWEFQTGGAIWSKPALASNGLVFFGSKDNKFYALRSETGQKVWEFSGSLPFCKPVVGPDNKVYVGSEDGKVYAFDFLGNKLWEFLTGAKVVASPTLDENGTLYVGSCDNKFYALRCTDGSKLWEFDTGAQIHTKAAISESGILYFGNNGSSAKLYAINSSNGLKVWDFPTGPKIWSSPAIGKNGNIYFGCHDSKVYCLRPTDGTQIWSYRAQSQITSPVTIGYQNTLFVATSIYIFILN